MQTGVNGGSELLIFVRRAAHSQIALEILAMTTSMNQDAQADAGPLDANTLSGR